MSIIANRINHKLSVAEQVLTTGIEALKTLAVVIPVTMLILNWISGG